MDDDYFDRSSDKVDESEKTDPGASRLGNFMNYYQFHSPEERIQQLPRGVWQPIQADRKYIGLDVGCNAGNLTLALHDFLHDTLSDRGTEISLLGVDLDNVLIERAVEQNTHPERISFECADFLSDDSNDILQRYLRSFQRTQFDVIFCFSITMWVHLNHGDEGLVQFLRKACSLSKMIVIEPQPWKCYRNASRRLRRVKSEDFQLLKSLKYTGDMVKHIEDILRNVCNFNKITNTKDNEWKRTVLIYERNIDSVSTV